MNWSTCPTYDIQWIDIYWGYHMASNFNAWVKRVYKDVNRIEDLTAEKVKKSGSGKGGGHPKYKLEYGGKIKTLIHPSTPKSNNDCKIVIREILAALNELGVEDPPTFKMLLFVSVAHSEKMDADRLEHQQKILKIIENHAVTLDDIYSDEWTLIDDQEFDE